MTESAAPGDAAPAISTPVGAVRSSIIYAAVVRGPSGARVNLASRRRAASLERAHAHLPLPGDEPPTEDAGGKPQVSVAGRLRRVHPDEPAREIAKEGRSQTRHEEDHLGVSLTPDAGDDRPEQHPMEPEEHQQARDPGTR